MVDDFWQVEKRLLVAQQNAGPSSLESRLADNATKGTILIALVVPASSYGTEKGPFVAQISRERFDRYFLQKLYLRCSTPVAATPIDEGSRIL